MRVGVFSFVTNNLGDDMQSMAVASHLPHVDQFLDRDNLASYRGEKTLCVFNSWFMLGEDFRAPSADLEPIFFGFHAYRPELWSGEWFDYLKQHEPIGCRDLYTVQNLARVGIDAYFSGCLTLFLGRKYRRTRPRRGVYFFDVPDEVLPLIPQHIRARAVSITSWAPPSLMPHTLGRWSATAVLMEHLANAELVVTRRLHAALPAAGFGTPVVCVPDRTISIAETRFSGYEDILNLTYSDDVAGLRRIDWRNVQPKPTPPVVLESYERFASRFPVPTIGFGERSAAILNPPGVARPGSIRLRLGDQVFDVGVSEWRSDVVRLDLRVFSGMERFTFWVEHRPHWSLGPQQWENWGLLSALLTP